MFMYEYIDMLKGHIIHIEFSFILRSTTTHTRAYC